MLLAALLFSAACEDTLGGIGEEVLPGDELIEFRSGDSLQLRLTSVRVDSSITFRTSVQLFGNYIDPQMGRISATTYTSFFPRSGLSFGKASNLIFDSLVLQLDIDGAYGRPATVQTLHVRELADLIPRDDSLWSTAGMPLLPDELCPGCSIDLGARLGTGTVRVRLDDGLGRRLLFADSAVLADRTRFDDYFSGLALYTDPVSYLSREPGAIFSLAGTSTTTRLLLYYRKRDTDTSTFRTRTEPFVIANSSSRFHRLVRSDTDGKLVGEELIKPSPREVYEFLQAGLQVRMFVEVPNLASLGRVAISRAELVLRVDQDQLGSDNRYTPPSALVAVKADDQGEVLVTDGALTAIDSRTSQIAYDATRRTYTISLTNYFQRILNGDEPNTGFYLIPLGTGTTVNRAVIGGIDHPKYAPKFIVTYSTLPR